MNQRTKQIILFTLLPFLFGLVIYLTILKDSSETGFVGSESNFRIEFGSAELQGEFIVLLNKHEISHKIEIDHLDRTWVVPDQKKRKEFDEVHKVYSQIQDEKVRKHNEKKL